MSHLEKIKVYNASMAGRRIGWVAADTVQLNSQDNPTLFAVTTATIGPGGAWFGYDISEWDNALTPMQEGFFAISSITVILKGNQRLGAEQTCFYHSDGTDRNAAYHAHMLDTAASPLGDSFFTAIDKSKEWADTPIDIIDTLKIKVGASNCNQRYGDIYYYLNKTMHTDEYGHNILPTGMSPADILLPDPTMQGGTQSQLQYFKDILKGMKGGDHNIMDCPAGMPSNIITDSVATMQYYAHEMKGDKTAALRVQVALAATINRYEQLLAAEEKIL